MIDEIFQNKMPPDSTVVVINSVMAALDEIESLQKAKKVMANRPAFIQRLQKHKFDNMSLIKIKILTEYL